MALGTWNDSNHDLETLQIEEDPTSSTPFVSDSFLVEKILFSLMQGNPSSFPNYLFQLNIFSCSWSSLSLPWKFSIGLEICWLNCVEMSKLKTFLTTFECNGSCFGVLSESIR